MISFIDVPKAKPDAGTPWDRPPMTWNWIDMGGKRSATLVCPNGHWGNLHDHTIADDGTVSPSVTCAEEGCDFHECIRLVGWSDEG